MREVYGLARRRGVSALIFQRLWSPFLPGAGLGAWDAGLSALTPDARPRRLYEAIGRLHPGFRGLVAPPVGIGAGGRSGPAVTDPPGFAIAPCPESA